MASMVPSWIQTLPESVATEIWKNVNLLDGKGEDLVTPGSHPRAAGCPRRNIRLDSVLSTSRYWLA